MPPREGREVGCIRIPDERFVNMGNDSMESGRKRSRRRRILRRRLRKHDPGQRFAAARELIAKAR